jgi:hypothetical protein
MEGKKTWKRKPDESEMTVFTYMKRKTNSIDSSQNSSERLENVASFSQYINTTGPENTEQSAFIPTATI